jgi:hypothetical protein
MRAIYWPTLAVSIALIPVLLSGCSAARPLHRPPANIRASLLKNTPLGTARADVERFIGRQGWRAEDFTDFRPPGWKVPRAAVMGPFGEVGDPPVPEEMRSMIKADFGSYFYFVGSCDVYGVWAFDSQDRLVQVWVNKPRDGL